MSTLNSRVIRSKISVLGDFGIVPIIDEATNRTIATVRGNATKFQFGFFDPSGVAYDLSLIQSLNLKIKPAQIASDTTLADQTLASGALDLTMDAGTWADGSKQHAEFVFTNGEMNLTLGGIKKLFWLVVTAILTSGKELTMCGGNFVIAEDNNSTADPPPENAGTFITLEQGDARYQQVPAPLALTAPPANGTFQESRLDLRSVSATGTGNIVVTLTSADVDSGTPVVMSVHVTALEYGSVIQSDVLWVLSSYSPINNAFVLSQPDGIHFVRKASGNDSTFYVVVTDPDAILSGHHIPSSNLITGTAGTAGIALGQLAIVTAQGGNTSPKIERDVFTLTLLSPLTWTPPGNLYQDPDSGFWYRQAILPGGGGAVDFGLAYT